MLLRIVVKAVLTLAFSLPTTKNSGKKDDQIPKSSK